VNDSERDELLVRLDVNVQTLLVTSDKHGDRITSLEHSRTRQRGVLATATAVVSAVWALVLVALGALWSR
jgi:hypothetical protein